MNDCMIDLETLGTRPGCVVLSIGAVMFNRETGELGERFHTIINQDSSHVVHGLHIDQGTVDWWMKQSPEALVLLKQTRSSDAPALQDALQNFAQWLIANRGSEQVCVWGNGSDFDQPIILEAMRVAGVPPAWKFWNHRCYRTLKNLFPQVPFTRTGTYHNALDDAISQAKHLMLILAHLNSMRAA